ncbi:hypothetical protein ACWD6P_25430 [Streptomyces sp. NPDC002446]
MREALTNVRKHAADATAVRIGLHSATGAEGGWELVAVPPLDGDQPA